MADLETASFISSAVDSGTYDPETKQMVLTMMDGSDIVKEEVPEELWRALLNAPSAGAFFNEFIRTPR